MSVGNRANESRLERRRFGKRQGSRCLLGKAVGYCGFNKRESSLSVHALSKLFQYLVVGINTTHRVNVRGVNGASVFLCPFASGATSSRTWGEKTVEAGGGGGRLVIEKSGRLRGAWALSPLASDSDVITARWFVCSFETRPPCRFNVSIRNNSAYSAHDSRLSSIDKTNNWKERVD